MNLDKIIFDLKKEHDDIFVTTLEDQVFIFRPLTKYEYDQFLRSQNMFETYKAEKICELCVLFPREYDFYDPIYAGVPETLMQDIISKSGFADKEFVVNLLKEYRTLNQKDLDRHIENLIIAVFPQIEVEDIKGWNIYKILDYYSRAEWIIDNVKQDMVNPDSQQGQPQHQTEAQPQPHRVMGENLMKNRGG